MNRKNFLRNAMMALAVSFVPKILQPIDYSDCVFDAARINKRIAELKMQDIINKKPPSGELITKSQFQVRYTCKDDKWSKIRDYAYKS